MILSEACDQYLSHREAAGKAANTIRKERATLNGLAALIGDIPLENLSLPHVDAFQKAKARALDAGAMNVHRNNLIQFLKWARARGHYPLGIDPMQDWPLAKVPARNWLRIPEEQFGPLLDAADHPADRFVIATEMFLFIRGDEVRRLTRADARLNDREMTVLRGKTRDRITVPWDDAYDAELRRWLSYAELSPSHSLVCAKDANGKLRKDRPIGKTEAPIRRALVKLGYSASELDREGGHTLRRSAALAWFKKLCRDHHKVDALRLVQLRLGHSTVRQTERYLGLSFELEITKDILGPDAGPMFSLNPALPAGVVDLASRRGA